MSFTDWLERISVALRVLVIVSLLTSVMYAWSSVKISEAAMECNVLEPEKGVQCYCEHMSRWYYHMPFNSIEPSKYNEWCADG